MKLTLDTLSWQFWIVILIIVIFILWLLFGKNKHINNSISPLYTPNDDKNSLSKSFGSNKTSSDNKLLNSLNSLNSSDVSDSFDLSVADIASKNNELCKVEAPPLNISLGPKQYGNGNRKSKGEKFCCQALEQIYGKPFFTVRPNFLKNPETSRNLELDCYNHEVKIAVEYNGIQHYVWPNFTGQTKTEFENQVRRDEFKREMCDRNGVYLITVPYSVPHNQIKNYITRYLPENVEKRLNSS
jgi:hypothetical protein